MNVATVKIRHKATGKIRKVNATDYAGDLVGARNYSGWSLVSERHNEDPAAKVNVVSEKEETENDPINEAPDTPVEERGVKQDGTRDKRYK